MNIGIDIVDIDRMEKALAKRPALKGRLFADAEREYCDSMSSPGQHYAVRFAAKEAVIKALGHHFSWKDVEVVRSDRGEPRALLHNDARIMLAGRRLKLSLSHSGNYAVAAVLLEDSEDE